MSATLRVSVAMCTYNGERFVREQLQSILQQTRPPDELVICDDASTDKTLDIVREMVAGCPFPVRLISNPKNIGFIKNFEKCIEATSGDIIFMSDVDDVWFPEKLAATLRAFAQNPDLVLTYCDAQLTDSALRPMGRTLFDAREAMQLREVPTAHQIGRGIGHNAPMIAFHAYLKPHILPFSNQWSQDHWVSFLAYAVGEVTCIDQPLLYYRRHGQNVGGDPDLDGGFWHRLRVAAGHSTPGDYAHRVRRFTAMLERLREIEHRGLPLKPGNRLHELIKECEDCLRFARFRQGLKSHSRIFRAPIALPSLMNGAYRHHAHGVKSYLLDIAIK